MFTKRTKYFLQHTPSIFTHAIIFYILYKTMKTRCKIYHFIHFKQPKIENTQRKNSQIHANNTNYMLLLNMIKSSLIHSAKLNQTHFLKNGTNDHYCIMYMYEEKELKATRPTMHCSICDYRIPVHTKHHPEENTAPIPQATMYVQ